MRISDWSSDVCSSDLPASRIEKAAAPFDRPSARVLRESRGGVGGDGERARSDRDMGAGDADKIDHQRHGEDRAAAAYEAEREADDAARQTAKQILDRKSVVEGKSVSVRVDLGGRRIHNKKNKIQHQITDHNIYTLTTTNTKHRQERQS